MAVKVLLVKPPEISPFNFGTFSLGVLAAFIRDIAEVSILDATTLSPSAVMEIIREKKPDVLGLTVMGPSSVEPVAALIRMLRGNHRSFTARPRMLVCGGHGASMYPIPLLEAGADVIVAGEGENCFRSLLEKGTGSHPGTVSCPDGKLRREPPGDMIAPLDLLPLPARDLMPPPHNGIHLMETSRGCPHYCRFCETSRFYRHSWRPFSPARVASEAACLVDKFDANLIMFADDNFAASPSRVLEICNLLLQGPLPLFFMASARVDDLMADSRVVPALASARISRVSVGVESLEPEIMKFTEKVYSAGLCGDLFAAMRTHGIFSVASFIVGLPGETPGMRERMLDTAVSCGADSVTFVPYFPLPDGSERSLKRLRGPDKKDETDAIRLTNSFFRHPKIIEQRKLAAKEDSIRGLIARAGDALR